MIPIRCPRCFRRLGPDETVHVCQMVTPNIKNRKPKDPSAPKYQRPSRPREARADYLAEVASTPEQKAEAARARQAAYRERQKQKP